jgi:hypothetical protein
MGLGCDSFAWCLRAASAVRPLTYRGVNDLRNVAARERRIGQLRLPDSQEMMMAGYEQFGELPEQVEPQADAAPAGVPRLRQPRPEQIRLR